MRDDGPTDIAFGEIFFPMIRPFTIVLAIALAACGGDDGLGSDCWEVPDPDPNCHFPEAPDAREPACDPVAQSGCDTAEKCTWRDTTDQLSETWCVPDGTEPVGAECTIGPPGETTGFDDCVAGTYCWEGNCHPICSDVPDSCDRATSVCNTHPDLFTDAPSTGVCAFTCEPGSQERLFDGAASCGSTPGRPLGCYGWAWTMPLDFTCQPVISDAGHGDEPDPLNLDGDPHLRSCAAGYFPWLAILGGVTADVCLAYCVPGESHSGDTANLDGVGAFTCASRGATGADIECRYLHVFEVSPPRDRYNSSGACLDVTVFDIPSCRDLSNTTLVDSNDDGTPDTPEHEHWGCAPWSDP